MADARDLRASQYLWLQMLEDGVDPSEKAYSSLYALVAKIHLLENRSQLSSLPYLDFKSMAPPKKWLRDAVKAKGAEKKKEASEEYTAAVEKWLTDNIEQIDSNAFKTATAVARAIPELSAAKARVILVKMKKDGTLKRIKDSDTTDPTSLGFQGAGTGLCNAKLSLCHSLSCRCTAGSVRVCTRSFRGGELSRQMSLILFLPAAEERSDRKKPKKSKKAKKEAKQEKKRRREEKFGAGVPEAHKPKKIDFGDSDNSSGSSRPPKRAKGVKAKVPKESWMTGAA